MAFRYGLKIADLTAGRGEEEKKMDKKVLTSIDKCIEELSRYVTIKVSQTYVYDINWDEELTELVSSVADLIWARVSIDEKSKTVTEVEIPNFLNN